MTDALLLRPVPQRRHRLADRLLDARGIPPCAAGITTWWELVDPADTEDTPPLALAATRHRDGGVVELVHVLVDATPGPGADEPGVAQLAARLLSSLVDALRVGSSARMLCAPDPAPGGLPRDVLVAAGFSAGGGYAVEL